MTAMRSPLDQLYQVFGGAPHVEEDEAQLRLLTGQRRQHRVRADRHQHHVALLALDVDLLEGAAAQLGRDALAQRKHGGRHGRDPVFLNPSTLTMAEASISGEDACNSRRRSTICCVRFFDNLPSTRICGGTTWVP